MSVKGAVMVPHPPLIVPAVGRGEEKKIQATVDAYHQAARQIAAWRHFTGKGRQGKFRPVPCAAGRVSGRV